MIIKSVLLAGVATFALAGAALAADPYTPPPVWEDTGVDWNGPYVGISGGGWFEDGGDVYPYVGVLAGLNFAEGTLLFGVEGSAEYFVGGGVFSFDVVGRIGVTMDSVLLFADGGVGFVDGEVFGIAGVGAEILLTEDISIAGQVEGLFFDGDTAARAEASLRFHF